MGVLLLGFGPGGQLRIWQRVAARRLSTTASSTAASSAGGSTPFLYRQPTPGSLPGVDAAAHHNKWWFCLLKSDEERAAGTSRRVHPFDSPRGHRRPPVHAYDFRSPSSAARLMAAANEPTPS